MSFDAQTLFDLLPAVHRIRDAALAEGAGADEGPLQSLLAVFAEQIGVVEENLEQLYDDVFIETCAEWVIPYIGDLIGYQTLHGVVPRIASPRAEVAHTIALRRRKGTALVLEQLARDVTGWSARVVEFFEFLTTTQYMNHLRPRSRQSPDMRDSEALGWIGTPFETDSRTVDVRRIESGRGRHNIFNVGLFLWRIGAHARTNTPSVRVGAGRYRASPLDHDLPLYNLPRPEEDITHIAEPVNVPLPLSRRRLRRRLAQYYGERPAGGQSIDNPAPSLVLAVNGALIERDAIDVCNLSDHGGAWAHVPPAGRYAIDPELGRIALPAEVADPADVVLTWHEGFVADIGGGEYAREETRPPPAADVTVVRVPDDRPTITQALVDLGGTGIVEITDSGRYEENPSIQVGAGGTIEIRAAPRLRPVLVLNSPMTVRGGEDSRFVLSDLLVTGERVGVPAGPSNELAGLALRHCTLVPGRALNPAGDPHEPQQPSLEIEIPDVQVEVHRAILGAVRGHERAAFSATDSIIDATAREGVAFAAMDDESPGPRLSLNACTVIGKVHAGEFGLVTDSILLSALSSGDTWPVPVRAVRKQAGCVRFSFLPFDSIVPPRYRCQPASAAGARRVAPQFTSLRYGTPAYCQPAATTSDVIRRGAEDESEMGVYHHLYGAQRETNLRIRLREYLRVGLHSGIFNES